MVNGSTPRSSSSRATRIANASESKPVSWSERSSSRGGSATFCSSAICCIAAKIVDRTDIYYLVFLSNLLSPNIGRKSEPSPPFRLLSHQLVNAVLAALDKCDALRISLNPERPSRDARENGAIEGPIIARGRILPEKWLTDHGGVKSIADQLLLFLLESLGGIERLAQPDEDRNRVIRQTVEQMVGERDEIEPIAGHDRRHAGTAIGAGNADAISRGVENARTVSDRIVHFAGRDVLAFPAKSIADPIDEVEKALLVEQHQVAGAKPGIALGDDVAQDLLLGGSGIGVTLEAAAALVSAADPPDRLAGFSARARDAKPVLAASGLTAFGIDFDDRGGKTMRQQRRNPADGAGFSFDIEQREIALGGGIEFENLRDRKTRGEGLPDISAQAVAHREPQSMVGFDFRDRCLQEIAAELADVLEHRAIEAQDGIPEGCCGE